MRIYDITQELFSCHVYPGDHVDAPRHFVKDGISIEALDLYTLIGPCTVASFEGGITRDMLLPYRGTERLLSKGNAWLTVEGAEALSECGVKLFGLEHQSIAGDNPPTDVHVAVLSKGIVAVEGLVLSEVPEGKYFLFAAPIKLGGSDGSPCRAVLIDGIGEV